MATTGSRTWIQNQHSETRQAAALKTKTRRSCADAAAARTKLMPVSGPTDATAAWTTKRMKERESEFTRQSTATVFCGTWNVNGQKPGVSLDTWLCSGPPADVYCIGFQELDLSASALVLGDTSQAVPWENAISYTLKRIGDYVLIMMKQLVGVLLCVYIKRDHLGQVSDLQSGLAATGIMGVMGNKGGVAARFRICDSSFCVVNSHLNAHSENVLRRNQDFHDIARNILFEGDGGTYTVYDHDFLFWIGDLNYRIDGDDADVRAKITAGNYAALLEADQLKNQMKRGLSFEGFFEAPIKFAPTYKYDKNSTNYDTSEKVRTPAWCDRVLWKTPEPENVQILSYSRHEILSSDHRPVSALFSIRIKTIIPDARSRVYQELLKKLDTMENECMPDIQLSENSITYGNVHYMVPQTRVVTLRNSGQVMARWRFIPKNYERTVHKTWLQIAPITGIVMPGEGTEIKLTVSVDSRSAPALNNGKEKLEDILVLHLENGKDFFVSLSGNYMRSSFGMSLERLLLYPRPVRSSHPVAEGSEEALSIPKELWRIVDWIYRNGMEEPELFMQAGSSGMEEIRECLDTGDSFNGKQFNVHSMADTMIRFLESLTEPVIPVGLYNMCLDASFSYLQCKTIVGTHLNAVHFNVFYYIMSFLREVLKFSEKNNLTPERLSVLFSSVILRRDPAQTGADTAASLKKKASFIFNFLVDGQREPPFM
eukprot:m51a1_g14039 hypothetical protein (712) ;mRNA; f:1170592-1174281